METPVPVEWVKRRGQRTLRLRVKLDKIVVSAPYRCPERDIRQFVVERLDWAIRAHAELVRKESEMDASLALTSDSLLLRGEWKPVRVVHAPTGRKKWSWDETDDLFTFVLHPSIPALTPAIVKDVYKQLAGIELTERITELGASLPFSWNRVFIRSQKTKWGTCSRDGHISLNWRLIKCPVTIWDYLIVHELCHTTHFDHSKAYWALVRSHYPDVDEANRWIKSNTRLVFADPMPDVSPS